jgi:hypothetical protein
MADSIQFVKLIADETRYEAAQGIPINNGVSSFGW